MSGPFQRGGTGNRIIAGTALTGGLAYGLAHYYQQIVGAHAVPEEWQVYAYGAGCLAAALIGGSVLGEISAFAERLHRIVRAHTPGDALGSAAWLSRTEARKAGLGKSAGLFLGILDRQPLFIANGVHGLVCAPARKGKTTGFVMPALCHDIGTSRLVTDLKGELAYQTAKLIEQHHGHRVIILNPAHKFGLGNASYNPLQIIIDDLAGAPEDAIADARSLGLQLHRDPPGGSKDPFWPMGTRRLIVFPTVALAALRPDAAHLPGVYQALSDLETLDGLIEEAAQSDLLGGELACMAKDIANLRTQNEKHFESFREGALQSLDAFGPSGRLAASTMACDFRFADLKAEQTTIFMVCDPSRMDVFAPWIGAVNWAAMKELIRCDNTVPVTCIFDEFTNYVLAGLPNMLTALGGYGIRCWMVVQELEEIARVYGREALQTILSQADVKQFFGVASDGTAQMVSRMLGRETVLSESYGMDANPAQGPSLSVGRGARDLMSPDEVRRLPEDEQIVFVRNLKPIRALKVGYQEVSPWRDQAERNPLHGGKRFGGKLKMRIGRLRARATVAGQRATPKDRRNGFKIAGLVLREFLPGRLVIMAGLVVGVITAFGWPHLRIEYTATNSGSYTWCRYAGPPMVGEEFTLNVPPNCPLVVWKKRGDAP